MKKKERLLSNAYEPLKMKAKPRKQLQTHDWGKGLDGTQKNGFESKYIRGTD